MAQPVPSVSAAGSHPQPTTGTTIIKGPRKKVAKKKAAPKGLPTSGDRLAAYLADPGLRSKLPDSALTPDLLKARQANAYGAAPAGPGSSYTNHDLSALIATLSRQKFGGAELALGQQGQALDRRQQTEIPAWFQAYRDQVSAAQQRQQTAVPAQVGSLQEMARLAAGQTGAIAGAPMDQASADRATAAAQIRSAGIGNQAALAQTLGGIQDNYLSNLAPISLQQQAGAQMAVGNQKNELLGKLAQLAQDKGDFKVTQRGQILSDESDQALKSALTASQIGAQTANAAATKASTTKTKVETTKTKADLAYRKKHGYYPKTGPTAPKSPDVITSGAFAGETKQSVAKMSPAEKQQRITAYNKTKGKGKGTKADAPKSGPGSLTPAAESKIVGQINKVYAALSKPTKIQKDANGNEAVSPSTASEVLARLRAQNVDPRVIDVARSLLHNGGTAVGEMGLKNAHDLGIHVSPHWKVVRGKKVVAPQNKSTRDSH